MNADSEDGYAVEPDQVYDNVRLAVATGIAGISIEDCTRGAAEPLHGFEHVPGHERARDHVTGGA